MIACMTDKETMVDALINAGCDLNVKGEYGQTALWWACFGLRNSTNTSTIKKLIGAGCDVNLGNDSDRTPLMIACKFSNQEAISMLMDTDINFNIKDNNENTTLHALLNSKIEDTVKIKMATKII